MVPGLLAEAPYLAISSAALLTGAALEARWSPLAPSLAIACALLAAAALTLLVVGRRPAGRRSWPTQKLVEAPLGYESPEALPTPKGQLHKQREERQPQQRRPQQEPAESGGYSLFSWLGDVLSCGCLAGRETEEYLEPALEAAGPCSQGAREPRPTADDTSRATCPLHPDLQLVRADERAAIDELARELSSELKALPPWEDLRGERCLLRFYRGHGSVPAAARAYREMLAWRSRSGANAFREAISELPWSQAAIPGMDRICRALPIDINAGRTAAGHVVWIERSGALKVKEFTAIPDAEFQSTWGRLTELRARYLDDLSRADGRLAKVVQIRDLRGFSASLYMSLVSCGALKRLQGIILGSMSAYPESIDQVVMLNAPRAFNSLWALVKPLLNDRMRQKFRFLPHPHEPRAIFDVGGASALVSLCRLASPDLLCPGSGAAGVPAGDFLDLAVRVPAGRTVRWQWAGDLEFSVTSFPEDPAVAAPLVLQVPVRLASASGSHTPAHDSVLLLRWANLQPWSMASKLSYSISVSDASCNRA